MKYLLFIIAFAGILPLGYMLTMNRKYMRYALLAVLLPVSGSRGFFRYKNHIPASIARAMR